MANIYQKLAVVLAGSVLILESAIDAIPAVAVTFTTDATTFLNSNPIVSTETFDNLVGAELPGSSVTIDLVTYTGSQTPSWVVENTNPGIISLLATDYDEPKSLLSFGNNQLVNAIGFNIIPFGFATGEPFFEFYFIVKEIGETLTTFSSRPQPGFKNFFGFSSEVGIKTLTVLQPPGQGGNTNWSYDDVSRSATKSVPEPTSVLGLLAIGTLGAGNALVSKQKQKSARSATSDV